MQSDAPGSRMAPADGTFDELHGHQELFEEV